MMGLAVLGFPGGMRAVSIVAWMGGEGVDGSLLEGAREESVERVWIRRLP
jgi:hypothetical protein